MQKSKLRAVVVAVAAAVLLAAGAGTSSAVPAPGSGGPAPQRAIGKAAAVLGPFKIQSRLTGKCLTNPAMSHTQGQGMIQWDCSSGAAPDQQWFLYQSNITGVYQIVNAVSDQCLAVPGGSTQNGLQLIQWPCGNFQDHFWAKSPGSQLTNWGTEQQVGLGAGSGNGVAIVQNYPCGCADQYWDIVNLL
ncbi:RICIN domain-containing protein [Kribbella sp. NPDC005582]|uniref:RICIN domain-containing protein n=1 Tax=Kribbella sp. NPDC005582 TaxID=3156893 RepID=UPI0033BAAC1C